MSIDEWFLERQIRWYLSKGKMFVCVCVRYARLHLLSDLNENSHSCSLNSRNFKYEISPQYYVPFFRIIDFSDSRSKIDPFRRKRNKLPIGVFGCIKFEQLSC